MKKLTAGALALMFAMAAGSALAGNHKTEICHFAGHDGDYPIGTLVGTTAADCVRDGGEVIDVSDSALPAHGLGG